MIQRQVILHSPQSRGKESRTSWGGELQCSHFSRKGRICIVLQRIILCPGRLGYQTDKKYGLYELECLLAR